jgi:hypothetical protein
LNLQKFAEFFLEMCLQEYSFLQYEAFTLACGVILAARKMVKVLDKWPTELQMLTGKKQSQVKRCMTHIFEFYEETFPQHTLATSESSKS